MNYTRTSVQQACSELRGGELKVWLLMHDAPCKRRTNATRLGRRWGISPKTVRVAVRALADKGYIAWSKAPGSTVPPNFFYALCRRLDASAGPFLKFSQK